MKIKVVLSQKSTRLGIVLVAGALACFYNTFGGHVDVNHIMQQVDSWVGILLMVLGMLGIFVSEPESKPTTTVPPTPDSSEPTTVGDPSGAADVLPLILQSQSEPESSPSSPSHSTPCDGVLRDLPVLSKYLDDSSTASQPDTNNSIESPIRSDGGSGYNG